MCTSNCNLNKDVVPYRRRNLLQHISPTLYRMCVRIVSRNIDFYNRRFDLSHLPWNIKTDLIYLNMKSYGFSDEQSFTRLLSRNVKTLMFNSSIITDSMLQCIAEQCQYLQELLITTKKYNFTQSGLCNSISYMKNLQVLQIIGTAELNDSVIDIISQNCSKLKCLWINNSPNVTDSCIESLNTIPLIELNLANTMITDNLLYKSQNSVLMQNLRDICLKNCFITKDGLACLNWNRLENVDITGASIDDLSFIPSSAVYKTLNWSI